MKPRHLYGAPWVWGAGPRSARVTEKAPRSLTPTPPPAKGWLLATLIHCPCLQLSCSPAPAPHGTAGPDAPGSGRNNVTSCSLR